MTPVMRRRPQWDLRNDFYAAFMTAARISHRFLMRPGSSVAGVAHLAGWLRSGRGWAIDGTDPRNIRRSHMLDVVMLILGSGSFAVFFGYIAVCDML